MRKFLLITALSLSVIMCKSQSDTKSSETKNMTVNKNNQSEEMNLKKYLKIL